MESLFLITKAKHNANININPFSFVNKAREDKTNPKKDVNVIAGL